MFLSFGKFVIYFFSFRSLDGCEFDALFLPKNIYDKIPKGAFVYTLLSFNEFSRVREYGFLLLKFALLSLNSFKQNLEIYRTMEGLGAFDQPGGVPSRYVYWRNQIRRASFRNF